MRAHRRKSDTAKQREERGSVRCLYRLFAATLFAVIVCGVVTALLNSVYSRTTVELVPTQWVAANATHPFDTSHQSQASSESGAFSLKTTHGDIVSELQRADQNATELSNATDKLSGDISLQFESKKGLSSQSISLSGLRAVVNSADFESVDMWMENAEKVVFIGALTAVANSYKRPTYLEWGSGGSTLVANALLGANGRLASVEHVSDWCQNMTAKSALRVAILSGKTRYICVNHSLPIVKWGRLQLNKFKTPDLKSRAQRLLGSAYVNDAFDAALQHFGFVDESGMDDGSRDAQNTLDFVLIDGRFRVGCALQLLVTDRIRCEDTAEANATVVIIHDFWELREKRYAAVLDWFEPIHRQNSMVVLRCNQTMSQMEAPRAKELYKTYLSSLSHHNR